MNKKLLLAVLVSMVTYHVSYAMKGETVKTLLTLINKKENLAQKVTALVLDTKENTESLITISLYLRTYESNIQTINTMIKKILGTTDSYSVQKQFQQETKSFEMTQNFLEKTISIMQKMVTIQAHTETINAARKLEKFDNYTSDEDDLLKQAKKNILLYQNVIQDFANIKFNIQKSDSEEEPTTKRLSDSE